jgi:uncharacterized membrane protein YdjX (TVP38/TMEM64 family)
VALLVIAAALAVAASSDTLHRWLLGYLSVAEEIIRSRPTLGVVLFVLIAGLSAMFVFVSSAVIVPVGVYVWGNSTSVALLWLGWMIGGACAYAIGRFLGRPVVAALSRGSKLESYEKWISQRTPFTVALMFQLATPSEIPGYLFGLLRYRFLKYLCVLAIAELPYAVATVYLGAGFVERRVSFLVLVGAAVAALSGLGLYAFHQRLKSSMPAPNVDAAPADE